MGTGTPFQSTNGGGFDAFVARLGAAGSTLLYATYLGGSGDDRGFGIARDSSNNVYVTGHTSSTNFPTTAGAFDTGCGTDGNCNFGFLDAYVAKLNPAAAGAASLVYSTYLGGGRDEEGRASPWTAPAGRTSPAGPIRRTFPPPVRSSRSAVWAAATGFVDAFVTRVNATGSALAFSTYLGGSSSDYGIGIFVDAARQYLRDRRELLGQFPHH